MSLLACRVADERNNLFYTSSLLSCYALCKQVRCSCGARVQRLPVAGARRRQQTLAASACLLWLAADCCSPPLHAAPPARPPAAPCVIQAGARVITNSYESDCWGAPCYSQLERDAIRGLAASALFVASAGNKGVDADVRAHYPSGYDSPNVVSVASSTQQDRLSDFSNRGRKTVHLAAPGDDIWAVSAFPDDFASYEPFSGTSMSAPVVSGAAVLLWSAFPAATVAQVRCASIHPRARIQQAIRAASA